MELAPGPLPVTFCVQWYVLPSTAECDQGGIMVSTQCTALFLFYYLVLIKPQQHPLYKGYLSQILKLSCTLLILG